MDHVRVYFAPAKRVLVYPDQQPPSSTHGGSIPAGAAVLYTKTKIPVSEKRQNQLR